MANLLIMGFERLSLSYWRSATIWDITQPPGNWNFNSATAPRSGGSSHSVAGTSAAGGGIRSLSGNFSRLFTGIGYMKRAAALVSDATCRVTFYDGTTPQVGWCVNSDGSISVRAGTLATDTLLGTTAAGVLVAAGTSGTGADYKMVELEVIFHASAGAVRLKVADVEVLHVTGLNTAPSGAAQANRVRVHLSTTSDYIDDFYVNDDSGTAPENTFLGEAFVVESIIPTGNGNSSQWVGSDGNSTDNYLLVDDNGNDDTDYVRSGTLNDLDTYAMSNLSNATGTIIRTVHLFVARKDDVATRTLASALRTNGTDYISATNKAMTGTYATFLDELTVNPDTSLRFTISEINALEVGQKVTT